MALKLRKKEASELKPEAAARQGEVGHTLWHYANHWAWIFFHTVCSA
jgi:hypothetical protein